MGYMITVCTTGSNHTSKQYIINPVFLVKYSKCGQRQYGGRKQEKKSLRGIWHRQLPLLHNEMYF